MSLRVTFRRTARADVEDIADYLTRNARASVGDRFVRAVNETLDLVAAHPEIGGPCEFGPGYEGLRFKAVRSFDKYLILYYPCDTEIDVVHVVYGGRDLVALLEGDPDPP